MSEPRARRPVRGSDLQGEESHLTHVFGDGGDRQLSQLGGGEGTNRARIAAPVGAVRRTIRRERVAQVAVEMPQDTLEGMGEEADRVGRFIQFDVASELKPAVKQAMLVQDDPGAAGVHADDEGADGLVALSRLTMNVWQL